MRRTWSTEELEQLAAVKPGDRRAVSRHARIYRRNPSAVSAKLQVLRVRQIAADVARPPRDPFPAYRFD